MTAAISAIISSVALIGVAVGLFLQARQLRIANLQTYRASHVELMKQGIEHPELWADPADTVGPTPELTRRYSTLNMQLRHLELGYLIGEIAEPSLRQNLSRIFKVPARRDYWIIVAEANRINAQSNRRKRRFVEITDEECRRAAQPGMTSEKAPED
jgi:Family of unknown function (DUF6082)